jgi:hypothetical protein
MLPRLGVGVDGVEQGAGVGVPEPDAAVGSAAPGGQQVGLEGAPGQRLDGGRVRGQAVQRGSPARAPHVQQVVVAAAGQLRATGRPLEPAHLLLVAPHRRRYVLPHPARASHTLSHKPSHCCPANGQLHVME